MIRFAVFLVLCAPCWAQDVLVELTHSRVYAADVFPDVDPALDLGPAPAPGVRRRVTHGQLLRWARQAGVETEPDALPDEVTLVRKLRPWPEAEAAKTVAGLLAEQAGAPAESVSVELKGYVAPEIPAGPLEWSLLGLPGRLDKPARLSLRWQDRGGRSGVESVTAAIRVRAKALVAASDLPAGAEIGPADFRVTETDIDNLLESYLSQFQFDGRYTLEREMKAGEPLREDLVRRRPDVERGAVVELLVVVGAVRLRAQGRAEGSGSAGDSIPFRNLATNQRVLARVADSKTAEVTAP